MRIVETLHGKKYSRNLSSGGLGNDNTRLFTWKFSGFQGCMFINLSFNCELAELVIIFDGPRSEWVTNDINVKHIEHDFAPENFTSSSSEGAVNENIGEPMKVAKKLNHNASERDRRKRVNELYAFLSSLLPMSTDQKAQGDKKIDAERLKEKLCSFYQLSN
ncbi:hypothetical protein L1987_82262 [Smallanthus sonchifolius]|uniref:Uncharacterized protein n=1 Tax=Smallanthus sonchifolius TaxID=185202 RepID=A0ACB8YAX2_9ASTR|nr:hypothetical protein L1987_82262 [Smallanthus sonchifolius]